ncbi:MAG: hypothetical protein CVU39_01775 [Chloroflexi bacterium HGW-Chloroflexi-10]|nr:MAG: hypothetical protein CVU39_01775 [Chloroflexi bacterium HGW-Chloroflexi-10]
MHIIMTHEQADFDALASLVATAMLQPEAYAILPRRVNRNVRSFLELYGAELPVHKGKDIPNKSISQITLVDTQALVTIKGINKDTKVHVVDHHQKKEDLPAHWTSFFGNLGSCTSLLIKDLQFRNLPLGVLPATLFLLGIYEDTGALTYANTTSQDLLAAAYLLEQGASLVIANQYLNPPLSDQQRLVYNRLLQQSQHHEINGCRIVTAISNAEDLDEEISSIAHKIRDLLDPDALFLLVKTNEGIRLVARSTTDQIHVGKIAQQFGGGGHPRAAAALVQETEENPNIELIYAQLLNLLPDFVEPAIHAAQIMSSDPRLITPQTSAEEAAQLMQRYGYEGYPVVDNNKILGLLTRRSVDRAISHRMNTTAASLMEAGEVFVYEQDSLETVQQRMTVTGWGQIPVLQKDTKNITGIVTRTDLLKALSKTKISIPGKKNLAPILEKSLPAGTIAFLKFIADHAIKQKTAIYIVGGFVRDLLLERPGLDFDIVVEGEAISFGKSLQTQFGGKLNSHKRFGTAKWQINDIRENLATIILSENEKARAELPESLDLISARTEFYDFPTALPHVERSSIKLDLHRRDFSINTLALRLDGQHFGDLYDYWGGLDDLKSGIIRVLHSLSFIDDPTRLLRAVRFEQRFNFQIEERTLQLLNEAKDLIKQVSGDRLRHEINLFLSEKEPGPGLLRLQELDLLSQVHSQLAINIQITEKILKILHAPITPEWQIPGNHGISNSRLLMAYITWFSLLETHPKSICKRLRTPAIVLECSIKAQQSYPLLKRIKLQKTSQIAGFFDTLPKMVLFVYFHICEDPFIREKIEQYITHWQKVKPITTGDDLQIMGIPPGPHYKTILATLKAAWLDDTIYNYDTEIELLQRILGKMEN